MSSSYRSAKTRSPRAVAAAHDSGPKVGHASRWVYPSNQFLLRVVSPRPFQAKLRIGAVDDPLEQNADRIAEAVVSGTAGLPIRATSEQVLQRKCAKCEVEGLSIQRKATALLGDDLGSAPPVVHDVLRTPGQPLDVATRAYFEPRFGSDFADVRVHTDAMAATSARTLGARAYACGPHIVFAEGQYTANWPRGDKLLSHELAHVVQQRSREPAIQRQPDDRARDHRRVSMHFNGRDLIVTADRTEVFRFAGQSGRPVRLTEEDARRAGADPVTDSYMNDARFVGVRDFGPIPEGTYQFSPRSVQRLSLGRQLKLLVTSHEEGGGDWGSGRVRLNKVGRLREGPFGSTNTRHGFFLHGGIMSGSSGCIDIGGNFSDLADWLDGYPRPIQVTVRYEYPPPSVGVFTGFSGMLAYQRAAFGIVPQLSLGFESSGGGQRFVVAPQVDAAMQWAGGALSAGVRLDIPMNDREQFIRLGLMGGANFRIFRALHGQIFGGYSFALTPRAEEAGAERTAAASRTSGTLVGAGIQYDFGRVQLGAVYDYLLAADDADPNVHQAFLRLGLRFP